MTVWPHDVIPSSLTPFPACECGCPWDTGDGAAAGAGLVTREGRRCRALCCAPCPQSGGISGLKGERHRVEKVGDLKPSGLFGTWLEHRGRGSLRPGARGAGVSWGSGSRGGWWGEGCEAFSRCEGADLHFTKFSPTSSTFWENGIQFSCSSPRLWSQVPSSSKNPVYFLGLGYLRGRGTEAKGGKRMP